MHRSGNWILEELHLSHIASTYGQLEGSIPKVDVRKLQGELMDRHGIPYPKEDTLFPRQIPTIIEWVKDDVRADSDLTVMIGKLLFYPEKAEQPVREFKVCVLVEDATDPKEGLITIARENWEKCRKIDAEDW